MAYSEKEINEIFNRIIYLIQDEGMSLRNALRQENMPSSQTFYIWIDSDEEKSKQYARACMKRADAIFEEILEIADEDNVDVTIVQGQAIVDGTAIQRSRLKVDARKWILSKMNPKKYGDKVEQTIQGGDKPVQLISLGQGINPNNKE